MVAGGLMQLSPVYKGGGPRKKKIRKSVQNIGKVFKPRTLTESKGEAVTKDRNVLYFAPFATWIL